MTYQTARSDLLSLSEAGLLTKKLIGKQFVFVAPPDLRTKVLAHQKGEKLSARGARKGLASKAARVR